ncbi:hypothetical protein D3C72_2260480 [compost metagenome]
MQIAQHQADVGVFVESLDGLLTGPTRHTAVTAVLKKLAKFFNDQWLIVDHKDFYCRGRLFHV